MGHVSCGVSGDVCLQQQLKQQAHEMEGLVWEGIEGDQVARPFLPWLQDGLLRFFHLQKVRRGVAFLCRSG
jgi:hypothetical protein